MSTNTLGDTQANTQKNTQKITQKGTQPNALFRVIDEVERLSSHESSLYVAGKPYVEANSSGQRQQHSQVQHIHALFAKNKTVRTYLYLLGYLSKDDSDPHLTSTLKRAIRRFQSDAQLVADNWVGQKTWDALQTLVSFEAGKSIHTWVGKPERWPALRRAVSLRLHVLGLLPKTRMANDKHLQQGLDEYYQHAKQVDQVGRLNKRQKIGWLAHKKLITALFDSQAILRSTAKYQSKHKTTLTISVNLAKIELFLLGFDVAPSSTRRYKVSTGDVNRYAYFKRNPASVPSAKAKHLSLYDAIGRFKQSNGLNKVAAFRQARTVDYTLIQSFSDLLDTPKQNESQQAAATFSLIAKHSDTQAQSNIYKHIQDIGGRIFDGIKRIAQWFSARVSNTLNAVINGSIDNTVETVKNLARLAHAFATKGLTIAKQRLKQAASAIRFLSSSPTNGSSLDDVCIARTKNSDFVVVVNSQADIGLVKRKTALFKTRVAEFKEGMRFIRRLVDGFVMAGKLVLGVGNPLVGVLGLVRVLV